MSGGVWTIGYGHTAGVKEGDRLESEEAAKRLLKEDLSKYGGYVNVCVKKGAICFILAWRSSGSKRRANADARKKSD